MNYRRIGQAGIKVSELSLGLVGDVPQPGRYRRARECMAAAWDRGVNFFDNAEVYALGKSEEIMGEALKKLAWPRVRYVVSTKFFWGLNEGPNEKNTLNRKYLLHGIDASLKRLQLDYVDLVYCHRPDPNTPIEETVWAMHDIVSRGEGRVLGHFRVEREGDPRGLGDRRTPPSAQAHRRAARVQPLPSRARREGIRAALHGHRARPHDVEPARLGILTGKYRAACRGKPRDDHAPRFMKDKVATRKREAVAKLEPIAKELGCTLAQLSLAWCLKNPNVSTVITAPRASRRSRRT
jgi:aryl-alcohol dehydrogenase-like predicted oxidoreductase